MRGKMKLIFSLPALQLDVFKHFLLIAYLECLGHVGK